MALPPLQMSLNVGELLQHRELSKWERRERGIATNTQKTQLAEDDNTGEDPGKRRGSRGDKRRAQATGNGEEAAI